VFHHPRVPEYPHRTDALATHALPPTDQSWSIAEKNRVVPITRYRRALAYIEVYARQRPTMMIGPSINAPHWRSAGKRSVHVQSTIVARRVPIAVGSTTSPSPVLSTLTPCPSGPPSPWQERRHPRGPSLGVSCEGAKLKDDRSGAGHHHRRAGWIGAGQGGCAGHDVPGPDATRAPRRCYDRRRGAPWFRVPLTTLFVSVPRGQSACRVRSYHLAVRARVEEAGRPHVLEVNPLPHLHPEIGDLCKAARAAGLDYSELLGALVSSARARWRI
jgi:hypothetical protein